MSKANRKYDIVIFGATSFTGKWLVHEVLKTLDKGDKFSWAISARSAKKMGQLLQEISRETGKDLSKVDMIEADVFDPPSLEAMAKQCQVVLNLVGPYTQWGEPVVKACAEAGTHYLDLAGEPIFLGKMEQKYSSVAEESGAYIIGACGFDSIPSDLGATYLQQKFEGQVNSVESILQLCSDDSPPSKVHYGTYHSGVLTMHRIWELVRLRRSLYNGSFPPKPEHKLPFRLLQHRPEVNAWCMFLPYPDVDVMERTQRHAFLKENRLPVQNRVYFQYSSLCMALLFSVGAFFFGLLAQFRCGLWLLERYPKFFSLGNVDHDGPSEEEMNLTKFTFTLVAKGWADVKEKHEEAPNKVMILKVKGTNPAYGGAVTMFLQSAVTIISEKDKMPTKGGVYSPGVAFGETNLVNRLNNNGVTFTLQK